MTEPGGAREELARDLKYLREAAGLSERQLAKLLNVNQVRIQRLETGKGKTPRSVPPHVVRDWAEATGADEGARTRLDLLVEAIIRKDSSWREKLGDKAHLQDEVRDLETESHTIRDFQLTIIPGLLQTPEYTKYILPRADVERCFDHVAAAEGRLRRQQGLFIPSRRFEFLISEAALRWPAAAPDMLVAQLDRILVLTQLETVNVAVLPMGEPPDGVPWSGFVIYESDDPCVEVEMTHRVEMVEDPQQVGLYRSLYERMWARSATGPEAAALIQRVAAQLRAER